MSLSSMDGEEIEEAGSEGKGGWIEAADGAWPCGLAEKDRNAEEYQTGKSDNCAFLAGDEKVQRQKEGDSSGEKESDPARQGLRLAREEGRCGMHDHRGDWMWGDLS